MTTKTFYSLLEKKTGNLVTIKQWESPYVYCGSHKSYAISTNFSAYDPDPIWLTNKLEDVKATLNGDNNNMLNGKYNAPAFNYNKSLFKVVKVTLNIEEIK